MKLLLLLTATVLSLPALTLEESIAYALANNNSLKQSDIAAETSKVRRDNKQAQTFGRVDLLASYDHYNLPRTLAPLTPASLVNVPGAAAAIPTTQDLFTTGIAYNVTLFNGFAQQSAYEISDLQYQDAAIRNKLGREELIYNVRSLYLTLLSLQEQSEAQKIYTEAQSRLLRNIQNEVKLGTKAKIDSLKAQNDVETSRLKTTVIESNIAILRATLNSLMGGRDIGTIEPIEVIFEAQESNETENITSLQRYKAAEINLRAKAKGQESAAAMYYPKIDFSAYYGQNYGPNDASTEYLGASVIDEGDWNNQESWQVGVHLKWNIFDFGARASVNQEARLSYMQAQLESEGVQLELRKNFITANTNIKLADAQYRSASAQYALLAETAKIEQVRYDNNALTLTDLLTTSAKKELAHAQMIDAKYSYLKAHYYLEYLLEKGETK
jgi:outer membrane protein TolC